MSKIPKMPKQLTHKIITSIIVIGLMAVMFAPLSISRQHENDVNLFQPAVAEAIWGTDAAIKIGWESSWRDFIRWKLIDLGKFLKLQVSVRLIQKAMEETEFGGIIRNYRSFIFDDLLGKTLDTIDGYFDDFLPDNVSPAVKQTAKAFANNEIGSFDQLIDTYATASLTSNKSGSGSASSTSSTSLNGTAIAGEIAGADATSFGNKAVAWLKTFFKAQFIGTKALSPDAPLIAFAQSPVPAKWQKGISSYNDLLGGIFSCNSDNVCNDTLKALEAIDEGMKEYSAGQAADSLRALVMNGYNPERDEDGNEKQWPGLAQALLEGNVQQFSQIITNSEDYTPSPITTLMGTFMIEYVFKNTID